MGERFCPVVRRDLVHLETEDGAVLRDPVTDRGFGLGPVSRVLYGAMDGTRSVVELVEAVRAQRPETTLPDVERVLRAMLLLLVLDGPGKAILERVARIRSGAHPLELDLLPDARFGCQGSGDCCQTYVLGPLRDSDVARIGALPVMSAFPELGPGPYVEELETKYGTHHYLKTQGTRCMFLLPEARCGLHAAFGPEAKPDLCRIFPFDRRATIAGLGIFDHGECASFSRASATGPTLAHELSWLRPLLDQDITLYHPAVTLLPDTQCDYGYVLSLRDALCALLARPWASDHAALGAIGVATHAFCTSVAGCPIRAGEPEATIAAALSALPALAGDAAPLDGAAWGALRDSASAQLGALTPAVARTKSSRRRLLTEGPSRRYADVLCTVRALATARAEGEALSSDRAALLRLPRAPAVVTASLRSMRYQVFSPRLLVEDRLLPGLEQLAIVHVVTDIGARHAALAAGAPRVELEHFDYGHTLAVRAFREMEPREALGGGRDDDPPRRTFDVVRAAAALSQTPRA